MLNTSYNILTKEVCVKILEHLEKVEKYSEPGVLVTIGAGKVFSAGFDLRQF